MSRLAALGSRLFHANEAFRPKILTTEKRVRGRLNGQWIFDTTSAKLVWETHAPSYWIPKESFTSTVSFEADANISGIQSSTSKFTVGDKTIDTLIVPNSFNSELAGYVKIEFKDLDEWYEEQQSIPYGPKDPFHRVDIIPSGRHVKIELEGKILADTANEGGVMSLWETNLPGRWYLPPTALNWQFLRASDTKTRCPYKGEASYYSAIIEGKEYKDIVWWYPSPTMESAAIIGMVSLMSLLR